MTTDVLVPTEIVKSANSLFHEAILNLNGISVNPGGGDDDDNYTSFPAYPDPINLDGNATHLLESWTKFMPFWSSMEILGCESTLQLICDEDMDPAHFSMGIDVQGAGEDRLLVMMKAIVHLIDLDYSILGVMDDPDHSAMFFENDGWNYSLSRSEEVNDDLVGGLVLQGYPADIVD